jgi:hypothetical protein
MKFFKYFGYLVVVVYLGGLIWLWFLPGEYQVSRTVVVNTPPSFAFDYVANLEKWDHWSPWEELDIDKKKMYEGAPESVGYKYYWNGNEDIGVGSIEIVKIIPNQQIDFKLIFKEPFESQSRNSWLFEIQGDQTIVTWTDSGNLPFFLRMLSQMMERKIGASFEYGLTNIKSLAERDYERRLTSGFESDSTAVNP